jgi:hypothetical protein
VRRVHSIVGSLFFFIVGLPLLPFIFLAVKFHWFEGKKVRERRITFDAGKAAIEAVRNFAPAGMEWASWNSAVTLTSLAYLESENEADIGTMRQINQEFAARIQRPIVPELLTELWDKLERLGPNSRKFITQHKYELLEHLGAPIKLPVRRSQHTVPTAEP